MSYSILPASSSSLSPNIILLVPAEPEVAPNPEVPASPEVPSSPLEPLVPEVLLNPDAPAFPEDPAYSQPSELVFRFHPPPNPVL